MVATSLESSARQRPAVLSNRFPGKIGLEQAIRGELNKLNIEVVWFERPGRHRCLVSAKRGTHYWTYESRCSFASELSQDDLDDWLFSDAVAAIPEQFDQNGR
jgi:hypothetical protein